MSGVRSRCKVRALCVLVAAFGVARADSPPLPARDHVACSDKGVYCAFVSREGGVSVFKVESGKIAETAYEIPGYLDILYVSDDGRTVIEVRWLVTRGRERDWPVVRVWTNGKLAQSLSIHDVLGGRRPAKTVSGYSWGHPLGFKGNHQFDLQLVLGGVYEVKF